MKLSNWVGILTCYDRFMTAQCDGLPRFLSRCVTSSDGLSRPQPHGQAKPTSGGADTGFTSSTSGMVVLMMI